MACGAVASSPRSACAEAAALVVVLLVLLLPASSRGSSYSSRCSSAGLLSRALGVRSSMPSAELLAATFFSTLSTYFTAISQSALSILLRLSSKPPSVTWATSSISSAGGDKAAASSPGADSARAAELELLSMLDVLLRLLLRMLPLLLPAARCRGGCDGCSAEACLLSKSACDATPLELSSASAFASCTLLTAACCRALASCCGYA
mmetsp:Transcript_2208/g.4013  ORF Transcript_2208/g.4013 Transcript_2208/m.4013 type:complete len:207 (+) Transcript_2208:348-968(+)